MYVCVCVCVELLLHSLNLNLSCFFSVCDFEIVSVTFVSISCASPFCFQVFKARDDLMSRANSLKKAVRQIIEHTEKGEWNKLS